MDTKLIREYGTEILSYRLRTVRQKKRMQYEDFDKKLLRLRREEEKFYQQEKDLGWEPLIPPVQKGWTRFFVPTTNISMKNWYNEHQRKLLPQLRDGK